MVAVLALVVGMVTVFADQPVLVPLSFLLFVILATLSLVLTTTPTGSRVVVLPENNAPGQSTGSISGSSPLLPNQQVPDADKADTPSS